MARDYRYGHKSATTKPRRTQQAEGVVSTHSPLSPEVTASTTDSTYPVGRLQRAKQLFRAKKTTSAPTQEEPASKDTASRVDTAADDLQKIKEKVHQQSLPHHIRKQQAKQEALEKEQAEQAQAALLAAEVARLQRRQRRMSIGFWLSIAGLTLLGVAWLLYAPFFLAFALEMGWVSEATRDRLDPAAALRSQAVAQVSAAVAKKPSTEHAPAMTSSEPVDPNQVQFTFYEELAKDRVLAGVQPIAVKTKAPMYLQLLSTTNEQQAQSERRRLAQKGYSAQLASLVGKTGNYYVLRMGPYDDQRTLNRLKVELQKLGIDANETIVNIPVVKEVDRAKTTNGALVPIPSTKK